MQRAALSFDWSQLLADLAAANETGGVIDIKTNMSKDVDYRRKEQLAVDYAGDDDHDIKSDTDTSDASD